MSVHSIYDLHHGQRVTRRWCAATMVIVGFCKQNDEPYQAVCHFEKDGRMTTFDVPISDIVPIPAITN